MVSLKGSTSTSSIDKQGTLMLTSSLSAKAAVVTAGTSSSSQDEVVMLVSLARPVTRSIQMIGEPEVGTNKETTEGRANEAPIPLREERSSL